VGARAPRLYKGDLVKVVDVDHVRNQAKLKLKLIPRVDLQELARRQARVPSFDRRHLLAWDSLCERECFEFSSAILRKGGKVLLSSYGTSTSRRLRAVRTFPWSSSLYHFLVLRMSSSAFSFRSKLWWSIELTP
jgi:hypothetical protein